MNFLLAIEKGDYNDAIIETKGFLETIGFGGKMFLLGMLTVFAVLGIIWVCLTVFKFFSSSSSAAKVEEKAKVVIEEVSSPTSGYTCDEEIVAVIAAAIAMAEEEHNGAKFRVVSFRRK